MTKKHAAGPNDMCVSRNTDSSSIPQSAGLGEWNRAEAELG